MREGREGLPYGPTKRRINPLEQFGFRATPGGRWLDPKTGGSLSTVEAWDRAEKRNPEKFRRFK